MEQKNIAGRNSLPSDPESAKNFDQLFFENRLIDYKQTAELLGCKERHVRDLISSRDLTPVLIGSGARGVRFQVREILRFIEKRKVPA